MFYLLLLVAPVAYYCFNLWLKFRRNWLDAKASGIPYVLAPVLGYSHLWLTIEPLVMPFLRRLPSSLIGPWITVVGGNWAWEYRFSPFSKLGTTFIVVSPLRNTLMTADPDVITQITTRRNDFPKSIQLYKVLEIYGRNLLTVEGKEWRRHRRITAPPFSEQNNRLVWKESISQAGQMVESWKVTAHKPEDQNGYANGKVSLGTAVAEKSDSKNLGAIVEGLAKDSMRMTLHIISRAGFDVRCRWPGVPSPEKDDQDVIKTGEVPPGYDLTYVDALQTLLHLIFITLLLPDWALRNLPFAAVQAAGKAKRDWGKYMGEMYDKKKAKIEASKASPDAGLDLMGAMIRGSNESKEDGLTKQEVMGDSFLLFLAGHETTANSIHFTILYLALHPEIQRKLQEELSSIFGDRISKPSTWDYDEDLPQLFAGLAGAIMNEELRLIPPVIVIPKCTLPNVTQKLEIQGKEHVVPQDTYVALHAGGAHRNPAFWPTGPPRSEAEGGPAHPHSNTDNDLEEFKPERWLLETGAGGRAPDASKAGLNSAADAPRSKEAEEFGVNSAPDTASTMFRPKRGAYIPFSDGYRACLGRRFAQVEILAMLAVIFGTHSVELDTSEFASYEDVVAMEKDDRRKVWWDAKMEAERKMRDEMATTITLQFRGKGVKVRVCERGKELFV